MVNPDLNMDIYLCVGFGLAFTGAFLFFFYHFGDGIWWIFGGTLIFMSPFLGEVFDKHTVKTKGVRMNAKEELQDTSRSPRWKLQNEAEIRRGNQERILLGQN